MKILIVGFGSIGKKHFGQAKKFCPYSDVRVMRNNPNVIEDDKTPFIFGLDEALIFKPDFVVIASPAPFHIQQALAFAEIGAHLLIEKPLSISLKDVDLLKTKIDEKGIQVLIGYNLRYMPSLIFFRNYIKQGGVGSVYHVHSETGQFLPSWRPDTDYRKTVSAQSSLGGGVLFELSHELDYLLWIFGGAINISSFISKSSDLEVDTDDSVDVLMSMEGSPSVSDHLDFYRHDTTRTCRVIGDKGTLVWNAIDKTVRMYKKDSGKWNVIFKDSNMHHSTYDDEWKNFLSCINSPSVEPVVTLEDGVKVLNLIERIKKSNVKGSFKDK